MPSHMKQISLACINVKLYSWPLTFRKVVRQQIWAQVVVLIQGSSVDPFWVQREKLWKLVHICRSYRTKWLTMFSETRVIVQEH